MIILRQKSFSWKQAQKAIKENMKELGKKSDYQEFWAKRGRDVLAKDIKDYKKSGMSPDEVRELLRKGKREIYKDHKMIGTLDEDVIKKIANL